MPASAVRRSATRPVTLRLPAAARVALNAVTVAVVVAALHFGRIIWVPFALAALLAFILDPLVGSLQRWRLPRAAAVAVVTAATLGGLGATFGVAGTQLTELADDLPGYQAIIEKKLRALRSELGHGSTLQSAGRLLDAVAHELEAAQGALDTSTPPRRPAAGTLVRLAQEAPRPWQALKSWAAPLLQPLATAGLAAVLLVVILVQRRDLYERLLRLAGPDLHRSTDALADAARRVSRYLQAQLLVNAGFGLSLGVGLWALGVPGASLWGAVAGLLRFVPYLGPAIGITLPMVAAFAVDPGWQMLAGTVALVVVLELLLNQVVEPWIYASRTGLAPLAVLLSTAFWTALWGPIGLVLATPLTVCCVVLGRHVPALRFLDLLLGGEPVFDAPTRLYQQLLAGHVEEAAEHARRQIQDEGLLPFYAHVAQPALGRVAAESAGPVRAEHRHRASHGLRVLAEELRREYPAAAPVSPPEVLCIGLRWEADSISASLLDHALARDGVRSRALPATALRLEQLPSLPLAGVKVLCLTSFHPEPEALLQFTCRRLRRMAPALKIVVGLWHAPAGALQADAVRALGADMAAATLDEAAQRIAAALQDPSNTAVPDPTDADALRDGLHFCLRTGPARAGAGVQTAQRAAEVFGSAQAAVWWADGQSQGWCTEGGDGGQAALQALAEPLLRPLLLHAETVHIPDLHREARLSLPPGSTPHRFFTAVPLRLHDGGRPCGALCLLDPQPRTLTDGELRLLAALAGELVGRLAAPPEPTPSTVEPCACLPCATP